MRVVVRLDLRRRRLRRALADLLEVGAGDDLAPRGFDLLHDARIAVELLVSCLLEREFLVDQALEHLLASRRRLRRRQRALLREHVVDLVDGDLFLVDLRRGLRCRASLFLLPQAASEVASTSAATTKPERRLRTLEIKRSDWSAIYSRFDGVITRAVTAAAALTPGARLSIPARHAWQKGCFAEDLKCKSPPILARALV